MSYRTAELRGFIARARTDASLFDAALRGDPVAFAEIYRRYHSRVYAFCLSRLMDPQLAEDAAQETFVRFLKADPDAVANPSAWLFTVARNVSVDVLRQRSHVDASADIVDKDEALVGVAVDSAQALSSREQGRTIMLAIRRLRPRYRTALILRELHGLSSAEIGEALDMTPGAVDTLVSRARDAFGTVYAEVSDLPEACAVVFPLIYKQLGTGLEPAEQSRLDAHLVVCERCRAESRRANKPERLAGALPFLLPLGMKGAHGGLGQLLAQLDPSLAAAPATLATAAPTVQSIAPKVAAVALALTVATAVPVAKTVQTRTLDPATPKVAVQKSTPFGIGRVGTLSAADNGFEHAAKAGLRGGTSSASAHLSGAPARHDSSADPAASAGGNGPKQGGGGQAAATKGKKRAGGGTKDSGTSKKVSAPKPGGSKRVAGTPKKAGKLKSGGPKPSTPKKQSGTKATRRSGKQSGTKATRRSGKPSGSKKTPSSMP